MLPQQGEEARAVAFQLLRADPRDVRHLVEVAWSTGDHVGERGVVEDHVRRDTAFAGHPQPQLPQRLEQLAIHRNTCIKISGIGPRTALSVLSGMSVADLAQAVTAQDSARIVKVPGIGKKTAERLLLELKGKLGADMGVPGGSTAAAGDAASDIQQALMALGYSEKDAALALKALPKDVGVSEGIKQALKSLAK